MSYQWKAGEGIADGFRRIAGEELDSAVDGLAHPEVRGVEATVHDVRKRCKKVRGLARLVRPGLAKATFREINQAARDAAAEISSIRDAHALLASFDRLLANDADGVPISGIFAVRAELSRRAHEASQAVAGQHDQVQRALEGLDALRATVAEADVEDDLDVLIDGVTTTYRLGGAAMQAAVGGEDDEAFHEWRKREKDLWYAVRLISPAAPAVLDPTAKLLHVLSEDLGDDHDLAVLTDLVGVDPEAFGGAAAAEAAATLAAERRAVLQHHAAGLGVQVYAEKPKAFARRLRAYWKAWERAGHDLPGGS